MVPLPKPTKSFTGYIAVIYWPYAVVHSLEAQEFYRGRWKSVCIPQRAPKLKIQKAHVRASAHTCSFMDDERVPRVVPMYTYRQF